LLEVSPSKRQVNIAIINKGALSCVILVLFWYYSNIVLVISLFFFHYLLKYLCSAYNFISGILQNDRMMEEGCCRMGKYHGNHKHEVR
jgi:hypothetical protein